MEEVRDAARQLSDQEGGALSNPWLLALDEAATICPLPGLPRMLAEAGGRNIVTLVALQDLRQAAERWGEAAAHSFLTLAGAKLVLPGYADTLQQLETLVGRHLVSLTTTTSRTKRHNQRPDDETESTSSVSIGTRSWTIESRPVPWLRRPIGHLRFAGATIRGGTPPHSLPSRGRTLPASAG